ncbi:nuclear transport factor 2 family protein [Sphingomonas sp.]|mgnify:CR=1 FL=1|jgi:hypothetical protein|uniref:nuclear transport factor 2 family protein n=1 Tax=Sphingomonas sp. TaxID=28214 RepID=UPI0035C7A066
MEDDRVWTFEESLWTGDAAHYRESIDESCLMVVPMPPFILQAEAAVKAVSDTPRWRSVSLDDRHIVRPQEGLIVVGYTATARRDGEGNDYVAHCTSTYRRVAHDEWRVVQHQQTPPLVAEAQKE